MTLKDEIKLTATKALELKNLFLLFLLFNIPLTLILQLKSFSMSLVAFLFLITQPLGIFLSAGFNGVVFLKINQKQIGTKDFFKIALKCFWSFIKIAVLIAIIGGASSFLLGKLLTLITEQYHEKTIGYFYAVLTPIIALLFVFAYPLVIYEYFSNTKLHPIKTSFSLVVQKASKIKLLFLIVGIQLCISVIQTFYTDSIVKDNTYLFGLLIGWPLSFLMLIYTYLKLSDCFYKDMQFNFEHIA